MLRIQELKPAVDLLRGRTHFSDLMVLSRLIVTIAFPEHLELVLGRFHPLLVHLPIGALFVLGGLEIRSALRRHESAGTESRWIAGFVCFSSIAAAVSGLLLSNTDSYDPGLIRWHRGLGITLAASCGALLVLRFRQSVFPYRIALAWSLMVLVITSHFGGVITHGRSYLSFAAPSVFREAPMYPEKKKTETQLGSRPIFGTVILPMLQDYCVACHNGDKHKAGLRLDTLKGIFRGGLSGPVVKSGDATGSALFRCITSAEDADGHMPPEGQPQVSPEEVAVLRWWIDAGLPLNATSEQLASSPELKRLLRAQAATSN